MNVVVIGGGPAGMMSAISSAEQGNKVTLLEKKERLGRKLLITGKGRCNITSSLPMDEFIANTPGNGRFLYSAFSNYTNKDIINFMNKYGLQTKNERGNRVFPITDRSLDVLDVFLTRIKELNIKVETNAKCEDIIVKEQRATSVVYKDTSTDKVHTINADKVILATGGKSYPDTGSTGDGYIIARKLGHTVVTPKPSLVPIKANKNIQLEKNELKEKDGKTSLERCQAMQGLNLRNVKIKIKDELKNKIIYEDFGEMIFTHFGVSGPTILSASSYIRRYPKIEELFEQGNIMLEVDLKPALTEEQLDLRIQRDFDKERKKQFSNSLDALLPRKMIETFVESCGILPEKKVCEISKKERFNLVKKLKNFRIQLESFKEIEDAIITAGGISVKEIDPKTMESKIVSNLYFAGEIIDVDAYTGGFNLQIAYSTGVTAGIN